MRISNIDAIDNFIGSEIYNEISSGKFHDKWFDELSKNNFIDKKKVTPPQWMSSKHSNDRFRSLLFLTTCFVYQFN